MKINSYHPYAFGAPTLNKKNIEEAMYGDIKGFQDVSREEFIAELQALDWNNNEISLFLKDIDKFISQGYSPFPYGNFIPLGEEIID